jgi:hypothetical protein
VKQLFNKINRYEQEIGYEEIGLTEFQANPEYLDFLSSKMLPTS